MSAVPSCVGMVLAGGRSSRMGGGYKAFSDLGGRSMLEHVLERLKPQVEKVVVSIEPGADEFPPVFLFLVIEFGAHAVMGRGYLGCPGQLEQQRSH